MSFTYSFHAKDLELNSHLGVRIASSRAYAVYSRPRVSMQRAQVEPGRCSVTEVSLDDLQGMGTQTILKDRAANGIELTYRINQYAHRPFLLLRLSISNQGPEPLHLHELVLCHASAGNLLIDPVERGLDFFKVGWHGWAYSGLRHAHERELRTLVGHLTRTQYCNPTTPLPRKPGEFSSEGWAILASERVALVVGLVSMADQFGQVIVTCQPGQLGLRLATQADGILLAPGESCDSEWGFLQVLSLPDADPAREYVLAVARQMGTRSLLTPPPLQWTHWYQFFQDISAEKFITNLEAINAVRSQVPFQVVQLDDGYQSAWGDWSTTNPRFPAGLDDLAGRIRQAGYTPGLWLAPFIVQPRSTIDREHPDWLLQSHRGRPRSAGFFYNFWGHALDMTHPAVQEHLAALVETLSQRWGFSMLKLDFLYSAALPGRRYDPRSTRAQALRRGLDVIRQAAGEETFLLGCGCPFGPAIGVVDAMRIGPDTAPTWEPYFNWAAWASPLLRREPSTPALRNNLRNLLNLSCLHRRWWWNDPDCLLVRHQNTGLSEAEVRSSVTLTGLSGGMMVDSDELAALSPERLKMLSCLAPILSPGGQPLDMLERDMPELYHVPVQAAAGCWHLVALFNWSNCPQRIRVALPRLGLPAGQEFYVFDFWAQRGWLTQAAELTFPEIPAHDCRLLRISVMEPDSSLPQLLGDTLHITQGLEIASWQAGPERLELQTLDLGRQADGALWLALPAPPLLVSCNGMPLQADEMGEGFYRIPLIFTGRAKIELTLMPDSRFEPGRQAG
ncbi:MAG: alpha-galactosidase [Anaerolineales bacterium]|nr:alpha-galactosidase [Anaerolineales bacterium]